MQVNFFYSIITGWVGTFLFKFLKVNKRYYNAYLSIKELNVNYGDITPNLEDIEVILIEKYSKMYFQMI